MVQVCPSSNFSHKVEVSSQQISPQIAAWVMWTWLWVMLICFCFFFLFVSLPHGPTRKKTFHRDKERRKKKKWNQISWETAKKAARDLIICNSSLCLKPSSLEPLKCMKQPCILMMNSPFGLASSCIFLLVAIGRVVTNLDRFKRNKRNGVDMLRKGQEVAKGKGTGRLAHLWASWHSSTWVSS